jgi:hypothetical protein
MEQYISEMSVDGTVLLKAEKSQYELKRGKKEKKWSIK